ncbi:hypothetical protein FOA52_008057 [Chlamydomonas sp. UWO 241]|nr:hypothetical protein FOA52_008057 [Chlamydomonas sp. UWO 241]
MNSLTSSLARHIAREVAQHGGEAGYRAFAVQHLQLKTVVKESHCSPVHAVVFNTTSRELRNLVASVGGNQATVYDDSHMGDYVAVVVHFANQATEHHAGGDLSACAWISAAGLSNHPNGDAWLTVAGKDPVIQILSVAEARVIGQLPGHTSEVTHLCSPAGLPGLLLSLSRDGNIRLWDVRVGECLVSLDTDATAAELHPSGRAFVTGHQNGRMRLWQLPTCVAPEPEAAAAAGEAEGQRAQPGGGSTAAASTSSDDRGSLSNSTGAATASTSKPGRSTIANAHALALAHAYAWSLPLGGEARPVPGPLQPPGPLTDMVEGICFLPGDRMAARSADGRIHTWAFTLSGAPTLPGPPSSSTLPSTLGATPSLSTPVGAAMHAMQLLWCVRVPGAGRNTSARGRCGFGFSADGDYLVAGTHAGEVLVYNAQSGARVATLESGARSATPVGAVAMAAGCRHLLAAAGDGFIFRYEYAHGAGSDPVAKAAPDEAAQAAGGAGSGGGATRKDAEVSALPDAAAPLGYH